MQCQGMARTNYVKVADHAGLLKAIEPFCLKMVKRGEDYFGFITTSDSGWPSWGLTEADAETGSREEVEFDFQEHIIPFLADGEVLISQEADYEGERYVSGLSRAFCKGKEPVFIGLDDIYAKAAEMFGCDVKTISEAAY